jgi:tRNA(fMet)-specific endonuclease VapC
MFAGAARSTNPERSLGLQLAFFTEFVSLPFDDAAAQSCGQIQAHLLTRGIPIGPNDVLIAAIALANGLILVTHNTGEFSRVAGLVLEDWEQ